MRPEGRTMEPKKMYRSEENKMLLGVCGGIGEYLNVDATVVRLIWAILAFWGGLGVFAYIAAAIIIPKRPDVY